MKDAEKTKSLISENKYYHGTEADQFSYIRLPKILFLDPYYKNLSVEAKVIYAAMLDRMSLSIRENWLDEQGRVYIYFTLETIYSYLDCKKDTALKILKELDNYKMIARRKQGFGLPTMIYVLKIDYLPNVSKEYKDNSRSLDYIDDEGVNTEVEKTDLSRSEKSTSGGRKNRPVAVGKNVPNLTENPSGNKTERECARAKESEPAEKKAYGVYGNVLLSQDEYNDLKNRFAEPDKLLNKVSCIFEEYGAKKNHLAYAIKIGLQDGFKPPAEMSEEKKRDSEITRRTMEAFDDETALSRSEHVRERIEELGLSLAADPQFLRERIAEDFVRRWGRGLEISLSQIRIPVTDRSKGAPQSIGDIINHFTEDE